MTAQEIFDKVAHHLLTQGRKALCEPEMRCVYRSPDGLKCAIGCLIKNRDYSPGMEGRGIEVLIDKFGSRPAIAALHPHKNLLKRLQEIHDYTNPKNWSAELRAAAEKCKLKPHVVAAMERKRSRSCCEEGDVL